jgi:hypothetical protein
MIGPPSLATTTRFSLLEWSRLKGAYHRLNRINAFKRLAGRGGKHEWMISQEEIERIRDKGLLPMDL